MAFRVEDVVVQGRDLGVVKDQIQALERLRQKVVTWKGCGHGWLASLFGTHTLQQNIAVSYGLPWHNVGQALRGIHDIDQARVPIFGPAVLLNGL